MSRARARAVVAGVVAATLAACSGGDGDGARSNGLFSDDAEIDLDGGTSDGFFSPDIEIDVGDDEPDATPSVTSEPVVERPDVDPLSCGRLLDLDDTDIALGLLELPMSERGAFNFERGETCRWEWMEDDSRVVVIGPGLPSDMEPDAVMLDVAGTPVDGVGDDAAWFVGGDEGLLAVAAATELGRLNFRVTLLRPDIGPDERRDVAIELARLILPRFPGIEQPPPPEVDLAASRPPLDRSRDGLVELLRSGVEEGRWTDGEGLLALLEAASGAEDPPDEFRELDGFARSATGLVALARDYIERGADPAIADELARLLEEMFPSPERLARAELVPASTGSPTSTTPAGFRRSTAVTDPPCADPLHPDSCVVHVSIPELDEAYGTDKYLVHVGSTADQASFIGWSDEQVFLVVETITTTAKRLEALGTMPYVSVLLTSQQGLPTGADPDPELCSIWLRPSIKTYVDGQQRQFIAGQMAHCFLAATYTEQYTGRYDPSAWWSAGAAIWLSNEVYPDANLEWVHLPKHLTFHELQTSIVERADTNGMWFQHVRWEYGLDGVIALISALPTEPGADGLAGWPKMRRVFHDYVQSLSDLGVPDSGRDQLAGFYDVPADLIEVDAPTSAHIELAAFRMNRLELAVLNGDVACIDAAPGGGAQLTWRAGPRGETGNWSEDVPTSIRGTALFAGSSLTDGGSMRITVSDVVDDPDDCEPDVGEGEGEAPGCDLDCGPSQYYSTPPEDDGS